MNEQMRKKTKTGILVAILVLAIGFAAVTTTLTINGTINIAPDQSGFEKGVIFKEVKLYNTSPVGTNGVAAEVDGDVTATPAEPGAAIGPNADEERSDGASGTIVMLKDHEIVFKTGDLKEIGETYTLKYSIENDSPYDALIGAMNCEVTNGAGTKVIDTAAALDNDDYIGLTIQHTSASKYLGVKAVTPLDDNSIVVRLKRSYKGVDGTDENTTPSKLSYTIKCSFDVTGAQVNATDLHYTSTASAGA